MFEEGAKFLLLPFLYHFWEKHCTGWLLSLVAPDQYERSGLTHGVWFRQLGKRAKLDPDCCKEASVWYHERIHFQESGNQRFAPGPVFRATSRVSFVVLQWGLCVSSLQILVLLLKKTRPENSHIFWVESLLLRSFNY